MNSSRLLLLASVVGFFAGACTKGAGTGPVAAPDQDTGVADQSSSTDLPISTEPLSSMDLPPDGPDSQPGAACPPGATAEDCQRCQYGGESCKRACPKVDCTVYPPPAACAPFCGTDDCCECQQELGNEYWWRPRFRPITCGTSCSGARDRWAALMRDPRMTACQTDQDCGQAGGPSPPSCECAPAIGGCYQAVNAAAYETLGAAALERQYLTACASDSRTCDCAPGVPGCMNGTCVMKRMFCCNCPPDAGQ